MPITIDKAYEVINLNVLEARKTMPPDLKEALLISLDALINFRVLRAMGIIAGDFRLKHEVGYHPPSPPPPTPTHEGP